MTRDDRHRTGRLSWGATLPFGTGCGPDASVCMATYSITGWNSLFDCWEELNDSVETVTWGRILRRFEDTTGIEGSWTTSEALTAVGTGGAEVWLGRGPFSGSSIWWRHSRPSFIWMQYDAGACQCNNSACAPLFTFLATRMLKYGQFREDRRVRPWEYKYQPLLGSTRAIFRGKWSWSRYFYFAST